MFIFKGVVFTPGGGGGIAQLVSRPPLILETRVRIPFGA